MKQFGARKRVETPPVTVEYGVIVWWWRALTSIRITAELSVYHGENLYLLVIQSIWRVVSEFQVFWNYYRRVVGDCSSASACCQARRYIAAILGSRAEVSGFVVALLMHIYFFCVESVLFPCLFQVTLI